MPLIAVKILITIDPFLVKLPSSEGNLHVFSKPEEFLKPIDENQTKDLNFKIPHYMNSWANPEIPKLAKETTVSREDPKKY